jgi:hypothetical protein
MKGTPTHIHVTRRTFLGNFGDGQAFFNAPPMPGMPNHGMEQQQLQQLQQQQQVPPTVPSMGNPQMQQPQPHDMMQLQQQLHQQQQQQQPKQQLPSAVPDDSTPIIPTTKQEVFLLTAADQPTGTRDERLARVIRTKYGTRIRIASQFVLCSFPLRSRAVTTL